MKRRMFTLLLSLLVLVCIPLSASADALPRVVDQARLLSEQEVRELAAKAETIIADWQIDAVIVTVDSLDGKTVQEYADDYYDDQGYGCGTDQSGILFLICMCSREWYMSTSGEARYIFTDYGLALLGDTAVPYLSDGNYYEAFDLWLDQIPNLCEAYQSGAPVDGYAQPDDYHPVSGEEIIYAPQKSGPNHLISLVIGAVVALVVILILCSQMNTAKPQSHAVDYLKRDTYHLHTCRDLFLYSHVSKTPRSQNNSSGSRGGGSSVHRSSSGRSHGGRGGRF